MLNKIWFGLLLIGIVYGFARGVYNTTWPPEQIAIAEGRKLFLRPAIATCIKWAKASTPLRSVRPK